MSVILYDVAIIGASLAGATCAKALANSGVTVTLIDKAEFPRRKPCGEGLSMRGWEALIALGCGEDLAKVPGRKFSSFNLHLNGRKVLLGDPSGSFPLGIGVSRDELDSAILLSAARSPNVQVFTGAAPRKVRRQGTGFEVVLEDRVILAKHLVLAEGARGVWASRLRVPAQRRATERFGFSAHYAGNYPQPAVSIIAESGFEIYVTPVGQERVSVACLGDRRAIQELVADMSQVTIRAALRRALGSKFELQNHPLAVGELGSIRRPSSFHGIFLAGDCCESFDPIGGMGMTHAILSGISCARSLAGVITDRETLRVASLNYESERERVARPLRGLTRIIAFTVHQGYSPQLLQILGWLGLDSAVHKLVLRSDSRIGVRNIMSRLAVYTAGASGYRELGA